MVLLPDCFSFCSRSIIKVFTREIDFKPHNIGIVINPVVVIDQMIMYLKSIYLQSEGKDSVAKPNSKKDKTVFRFLEALFLQF